MPKKVKLNKYETFTQGPLDDVPNKRLAVIVNPMSGGKKGLKILEQVTAMVKDEGVTIKPLYTEYAGHARELALTTDLSEVDVLCCVGGDGTAHETINGFLSRGDDDEAKKRVVIGIIPGGSGNTLAFDLKITSPEFFVAQLLKGHVRAADAVEVTKLVEQDQAASPEPQPEDEEGGSSAALVPSEKASSELAYPDRCFSVNMIGYGLPANVLRTANSLRWMGSAQYNVAALSSLVFNRPYKATISMVDANGEAKEISGSYVMVQAQVTVHMGEKMPFCPDAKLDDGLIDLVVVHHAGRISLYNIMEQAKHGNHVNSSKVSYYQVKSFNVKPLKGEKHTGPNSVNVDGELIGHSPFQATMVPSAVRLITG